MGMCYFGLRGDYIGLYGDSMWIYEGLRYAGITKGYVGTSTRSLLLKNYGEGFACLWLAGNKGVDKKIEANYTVMVI